MKSQWVRGVAALALLVFPLTALTADDKEKDKDKPKSDPAGSPIQATLTTKKKTYKLDLGGKTAEQFKKSIEDAEGNYPAAPKVDLVLELKNTSDKDVEVWIDGDATKIMLDLKGKGAINTALKGLAFTADFRGPKPTTIQAGKSHKFEIKSLTYGSRGASHRSYWTQAGDYTLTATFETATSPAVKGAKNAEGKFGFVKLISVPLKIKVTE
jgi:hypothetical protein